MCTMHNSFWWGTQINDFLFKGYTINSVGGLIATCLMLTTFSIAYEFMKVFQAKLRQEDLKRRREALLVQCPNASSFSIERESNERKSTYFTDLPYSDNRFCRFLYEFFLWLSLELVGYILMLAVMLFNGYMTVAVTIGSGIGNFIFGATLQKINLENRRVKKESLCLISSCEEPDVNRMIRTTGSIETTTTITEHGSQEEIMPIQCTVAVHSEND